MKAIQNLHEMGQSLWLDNLARDLLTSGTLRRYIKELSVTGLTSNPTIFDHAIKNGQDNHGAIRQTSKNNLTAMEPHASGRRPNIKSWNKLIPCLVSTPEVFQCASRPCR